MRQRKTRDIYEVRGDYGYGHGFETVTAETTYKEAKLRRNEYQQNEPNVVFRIHVVRERIIK